MRVFGKSVIKFHFVLLALAFSIPVLGSQARPSSLRPKFNPAANPARPQPAKPRFNRAAKPSTKHKPSWGHPAPRLFRARGQGPSFRLRPPKAPWRRLSRKFRSLASPRLKHRFVWSALTPRQVAAIRTRIDGKLATRFNRTIRINAKNRKLRNIVNQQYRREAKIGSGSTAAAIRHFVKTGQGKNHLVKGVADLNGLRNLLRSKKIRLSRHDSIVAKSLERDLTHALGKARAKGLLRVNRHRWQHRQSVHDAWKLMKGVKVEHKP